MIVIEVSVSECVLPHGWPATVERPDVFCSVVRVVSEETMAGTPEWEPEDRDAAITAANFQAGNTLVLKHPLPPYIRVVQGHNNLPGTRQLRRQALFEHGGRERRVRPTPQQGGGGRDRGQGQGR